MLSRLGLRGVAEMADTAHCNGGSSWAAYWARTAGLGEDAGQLGAPLPREEHRGVRVGDNDALLRRDAGQHAGEDVDDVAGDERGRMPPGGVNGRRPPGQ